MAGLNGRNIARNVAGHGLTMAALTALIWLIEHVDGWFDRHGGLPLKTMVYVVPVGLAIILVAHFIIPKKDIHANSGKVYDRITYSHDDPCHVLWPSRVAGVAVVLAMAYLWGDVLIALLARLAV